MKKKLHEMTKEEYETLYRSGFMGEFYPEASGCYEKDVVEHDEGRINAIGQNGPTGEHYITLSEIKERESRDNEKFRKLNDDFLEPLVKALLPKFSLGTYQRAVKDGVIDIYDILELYKVYNPAAAHAVKKLLMAGGRGYKDVIQDLEEAKQSITRAIELEKSYREA